LPAEDCNVITPQRESAISQSSIKQPARTRPSRAPEFPDERLSYLDFRLTWRLIRPLNPVRLGAVCGDVDEDVPVADATLSVYPRRSARTGRQVAQVLNDRVAAEGLDALIQLTGLRRAVVSRGSQLGPDAGEPLRDRPDPLT
jgi:hypothetical protein